MDFDLPLSSNGPAYRRTEQREGVPLDYVAEKLRDALDALHAHIRLVLDPSGSQYIDYKAIDALPLEIHEALHKTVVAFLALHNMLAYASDHHLTRRLLCKNAGEFELWADAVERGGSVYGIDL